MSMTNPINLVTSTDDEAAQVKADETALLSPGDEQAKAKLERQLAQRPEKNELVEKNILKNSSAAPALHAAQANLERARLEDKLDHALQARPNPEELVREGILQKDEIPGA